MGRLIKEGENPVGENEKVDEQYPKYRGHVKSRGKMGGPSSKAKYYVMTDSEPVL